MICIHIFHRVNETFSIKVNGKDAEYKTENGYAVIDREWKAGDIIEYVLPLNIHRVTANINVTDDTGKVAIERGPIVYCLEGIDNNNKIDNIILPDDEELSILDGINEFTGVKTIIGGPGRGTMHRAPTNNQITAIPYYLWNNRGITKMMVWIPHLAPAR